MQITVFLPGVPPTIYTNAREFVETAEYFSFAVPIPNSNGAVRYKFYTSTAAGYGLAS